MREARLNVADMKCQGCVRALDEALRAVVGVQAVNTSLVTRCTTVTYQHPATVAEVLVAVAGIGKSATLVTDFPVGVAQPGGSVEAVADIKYRVVDASPAALTHVETILTAIPGVLGVTSSFFFFFCCC
eukprot:GHVU01010004.1.p1 GENE.GHVU01010004.1~~GHVU01010004.1.p1  ORF type:complete len:129 (-),score=15.09 GHVU01010004.1:15-401(-)